MAIMGRTVLSCAPVGKAGSATQQPGSVSVLQVGWDSPANEVTLSLIADTLMLESCDTSQVKPEFIYVSININEDSLAFFAYRGPHCKQKRQYTTHCSALRTKVSQISNMICILPFVLYHSLTKYIQRVTTDLSGK